MVRRFLIEGVDEGDLEVLVWSLWRRDATFWTSDYRHSEE